MPLYEYECKSCGYEFEELKNDKNDNHLTKCKKCECDAERKMSAFATIVEGSPNESIDIKVGREAGKRWQMHRERQDKRRNFQSNQKLRNVKVPVDNTPIMVLGNKEEQGKRGEFSTALQEHKKDRKKRGQEQFTETGPF